MPGYLLDTNVIIDALNGKRGRGALLKRLLLEGSVLGCCAVNIAEVYAGMRPQEEERTREFFRSLEYHDITPAIARQGGLLKRDWRRKGLTLSVLDTLVAAVALEYNLTLLTDNVKHFPMPEIRLFPLP
ncbi:MAG: type II toxin-antitoxin system VapC family toxin [Acidobacteriota bacterium]